MTIYFQNGSAIKFPEDFKDKHKVYIQRGRVSTWLMFDEDQVINLGQSPVQVMDGEAYYNKVVAQPKLTDYIKEFSPNFQMDLTDDTIRRITRVTL